MVSGHTQAVDSAPIKANASMESVVLKAPVTSIEDHLEQMEKENQEAVKRPVRSKKQYASVHRIIS